MNPGLSLVLLVLMLGACSSTAGAPHRGEPGTERAGVFREVPAGGEAAQGFVLFTLEAELKTHHKDFYLLEPRTSPHGKNEYPIVITIDGQQATWEMPGTRSDTSLYDERGEVTCEGGNGMRYTLRRQVALSPGRHMLTIVLPGDDYAVDIPISLPSGRSSVLVLKPEYEQGGIGHHENFLHGFRKFDLFLNGRELS